jgi:hypothetical protein
MSMSEIEMLRKQNELLQEQNRLLREGGEAEDKVVYPAGPGERVLMPADDKGKRIIRVVPNDELGIANLFSVKGVEVYVGEVPQCGFIMETPEARVYKGPQVKEPVEPTEEATVKLPAGAPPEFNKTKPKVLTDPERLAAVTAAILGLKKDDFNASGFPGVAALTGVVGFQVTAKERDAAFAKFQESQPDWEVPTE